VSRVGVNASSPEKGVELLNCFGDKLLSPKVKTVASQTDRNQTLHVLGDALAASNYPSDHVGAFPRTWIVSYFCWFSWTGCKLDIKNESRQSCMVLISFPLILSNQKFIAYFHHFDEFFHCFSISRKNAWTLPDCPLSNRRLSVSKTQTMMRMRPFNVTLPRRVERLKCPFLELLVGEQVKWSDFLTDKTFSAF